MFSFQPIDCDFGDKPAGFPAPARSSVPANPGSTNSEDKNLATSQQPESANSPPIPDEYPSSTDLARAFKLSLAACGLVIQMSDSDPVHYYVPPSPEAPSHYSLRPARSGSPAPQVASQQGLELEPLPILG